jgi:chemotaxis protein methyltransferase CheR
MLLEKDIVLTEKDFKTVSNLVYKHCGINLHVGKKELIRSRLMKRIRMGNYESFSQYLDGVIEDKTGKEFSAFIDLLSTNLTSFFREPQHFEFLRNNFIPSLLERKRKKRDFKIRAWSAGCSSGEEVYSIAITFLDALDGLGKWDVKILGTDISSRMLESARNGIFNSDRVSPVSAQQKNKYLIKKRMDGRAIYEVKRNLRSIVFFAHLNLMSDWPIKGPLDFIFCRNVMIYFDKPTQQNLINRYWEILDSGAVLFTGHSESLTGIKHRFNYIQPTIYSKQ